MIEVVGQKGSLVEACWKELVPEKSRGGRTSYANVDFGCKQGQERPILSPGDTVQRRRGSEEPPSCLQITAGLAAEKEPAGREDRRTAGGWKTTGLPIRNAVAGLRAWVGPDVTLAGGHQAVQCGVFSKHIRPLDCHRRRFLGSGPGCAGRREGRGLTGSLRGWVSLQGRGCPHRGQRTLCFWVLGTVKRGWVTVICVRAQQQVNWKCRRQG